MQLLPLVHPSEDLTNDEISRYSRHLLIPDVGLEGQQRLKNSRVLVIGAGGLGSPVLLYLAAAGVGTLGIIDFDIVDESNLQRQIIHGQSDIGRFKSRSAKDSVNELNPYVHVQLHNERLEATNAVEIISGYDLIVDGTDNFSTRYLVNDACVLAEKPYVWGSIFRFEGQASVFWENAPGGGGLNYRDLYPEPPPSEMAPSCAEGGVLGILCASIGAIMATEAIKLITGLGDTLLGRLAVYDALDMTYRFIPIRRAPVRTPITGLIDYQEFCGQKRAVTDSKTDVPVISALELKKMRESGTDLQLIDVRGIEEWNIVHIEGANHIPKNKIMSEDVLSQFNKEDFIVLHCKMGVRSKDVLFEMRKQGFTNVKSLDGGILAWIRDVDRSLPRY
ncbi:adenylyltransferase/sulfurtransferase [Nitrosospira sp. Nsp5]|uniref:Adenylyltransferase and sulfurtransferase n=1 Tax=Nitrosospira multiformis TaxID=1231 RepID=A0ABY0TAP4_9PROT|nr:MULTISPECIES: molybdopterin-synthase adenylyltransferase MoeB [Nitrosospira]PTR08416.1 adenylyltransferase/sulfurtransferase [Nitrosospira sp. Nsp5]SDQ54461.1 adenylyltransferase and sulfurtransferase [Nitrosospira multiformis]